MLHSIILDRLKIFFSVHRVYLLSLLFLSREFFRNIIMFPNMAKKKYKKSPKLLSVAKEDRCLYSACNKPQHSYHIYLLPDSTALYTLRYLTRYTSWMWHR